jgi:hypothetical protein
MQWETATPVGFPGSHFPSNKQVQIVDQYRHRERKEERQDEEGKTSKNNQAQGTLDDSEMVSYT